MNSLLYKPVSIGQVDIPGNLFLAPVAGYSDRAFRSICIAEGANLCYTEMVSAEALWRGSGKTEMLLLRGENEQFFAPQIFGGEVESMKKATRILVEKYTPSLIDINAGCPVPKIIKSNAGSALTRDPRHLYAITKAVVDEAGSIPVTIKIRSGWDAKNLNWKETSQAAYEAGAQAICLHARTRAQGYEGFADWQILGELVAFIGNKLPVFGSGDVFSPEAAKEMLEKTGCHALMFARGAMGNPFIFRQTRDLLLSNCYEATRIEDKVMRAMQELDLLIADKGEELACREMRKRFSAYSKGLEGGGQMRFAIVSATKKADYEEIFKSFL
jgi:tRNA-dihydrouridine synthase B